MKKNTTAKTKSTEILQILLVGNNPIELGFILDKLNSVRTRKIVTEIAFDRKTIADRFSQFKPDYVLIDDNIGKNEMAQCIEFLCSNLRLKGIPITVLKNSNYNEAFISSCVVDYTLKQNWSVDSLFIALKNSLKFFKTQRRLQVA